MQQDEFFESQETAEFKRLHQRKAEILNELATINKDLHEKMRLVERRPISAGNTLCDLFLIRDQFDNTQIEILVKKESGLFQNRITHMVDLGLLELALSDYKRSPHARRHEALI